MYVSSSKDFHFFFFFEIVYSSAHPSEQNLTISPSISFSTKSPVTKIFLQFAHSVNFSSSSKPCTNPSSASLISSFSTSSSLPFSVYTSSSNFPSSNSSSSTIGSLIILFP